MSLSNRLVLGVTCISVVMLALLVWNSVRLINWGHAQIIERSTQEKTVLLSQLLVPGLFYNDRAILNDVLKELQRDAKENLPTSKSSRTVLFKDLVYAEVYDRNGRLMATLHGSLPPAYKVRKRQIDSSYQDALRDGVYDIKSNINMRAEGAKVAQFQGVLRAGFSIKIAEELSAKVQWQNTLIAILSVILTIAATVLLGFLLTRQLRRVEQGARALQRGEFSHQIPIKRKTEFGDLANAFNELANHLGQTRDELNSNHEALLREKRRLQTLIDGVDAVMWEMDPTTLNFVYVSNEAQNLLGYSRNEWLDAGFFRDHLHPDDLDWVLSEMKIERERQFERRRDFRMLTKEGKILWIREISNSERDSSGAHTIRGLFLDVTEETANEERVLFLAEHDYLTGLYNRRRFQSELRKQIDYAKRYEATGALLFIDLDQFKYVNDSFGHQIGDEILVEIASRLSQKLSATGFLGRLGGDEFGVILPKADHEQAELISESLCKAISETVDSINLKSQIHVSASIGIAVFPEQSDNESELLALADAAMYTAKDKGRNQFHLYHANDKTVAAMQAKVHWEERIIETLNEQKGRFELYYQPIVDLRSGATVHYEVLLRMIDENEEIVLPGEFLDTAERFGLIRKIDHWVISTAIKKQAESIIENRPIELAINISSRHFGQSEVFELVKKAIHYYGANPRALIFEVTETAAVEHFHEARPLIDAFRSLGCRFALDDFGIGFSSLYYLKNLPIDYVKIDGSFVRHLHRDNRDAKFIKAMTNLAHDLNIETIAECIEFEETLPILRHLGVDYGQGFYIGRPSCELIEPTLEQTKSVLSQP